MREVCSGTTSADDHSTVKSEMSERQSIAWRRTSMQRSWLLAWVAELGGGGTSVKPVQSDLFGRCIREIVFFPCVLPDSFLFLINNTLISLAVEEVLTRQRSSWYTPSPAIYYYSPFPGTLIESAPIFSRSDSETAMFMSVRQPGLFHLSRENYTAKAHSKPDLLSRSDLRYMDCQLRALRWSSLVHELRHFNLGLRRHQLEVYDVESVVFFTINKLLMSRSQDKECWEHRNLRRA
jgi:hypothetical protein